MKPASITIIALIIIQAVQAANVLRRQRRDLIGYNRQQNNVLGHMRWSKVNNNEDMSDLTQQILKFMSKNGNKSASSVLKRNKTKRESTSKPAGRSGRSSRLRRFKNYHQ